jgi:hypothetical protein
MLLGRGKLDLDLFVVWYGASAGRESEEVFIGVEVFLLPPLILCILEFSLEAVRIIVHAEYGSEEAWCGQSICHDDAGRPYTLFGSGGGVFITQLPSSAVEGPGIFEAVRLVQGLSKIAREHITTVALPMKQFRYYPTSVETRA